MTNQHSYIISVSHQLPISAVNAGCKPKAVLTQRYSLLETVSNILGDQQSHFFVSVSQQHSIANCDFLTEIFSVETLVSSLAEVIHCKCTLCLYLF